MFTDIEIMPRRHGKQIDGMRDSIYSSDHSSEHSPFHLVEVKFDPNNQKNRDTKTAEKEVQKIPVIEYNGITNEKNKENKVPQDNEFEIEYICGKKIATSGKYKGKLVYQI